MQTVKNILVATDFSRSATNAMVYAINLAQQVNLKLHILHVKDVKHANSRKSDSEIEAQFDIIRHDYLFLRNVDVRFIIKEGPIAEVINEEVRLKHIDLVITGVKGASGNREALFGSITVKLIDQPSCAIIAVPNECYKLALDRLLIASDFNESPNENELYVLSFLAEALSSQVYVFNIKSAEETDEVEEQKMLEKFKAVFKYNKVHFDRINVDNISKGINEYGLDNDLDLITVFRFMDIKGNPMKRSISKQLALSGQLPLLVIPTKIN